jgi:hypothetical protein
VSERELPVDGEMRTEVDSTDRHVGANTGVTAESGTGTPAGGAMREALTPTTATRGSTVPGSTVAPGSAPSAATGPANAVALAVQSLETLHERELAEHPDIYQDIHTHLLAALSAIEPD